MPERPLPAGEDRCPRCDARFGCEIATGGCWCAELTIGDDQRTRLAAAYEGCLCPSCLRELAAAR